MCAPNTLYLSVRAISVAARVLVYLRLTVCSFQSLFALATAVSGFSEAVVFGSLITWLDGRAIQ